MKPTALWHSGTRCLCSEHTPIPEKRRGSRLCTSAISQAYSNHRCFPVKINSTLSIHGMLVMVMAARWSLKSFSIFVPACGTVHMLSSGIQAICWLLIILMPYMGGWATLAKEKYWLVWWQINWMNSWIEIYIQSYTEKLVVTNTRYLQWYICNNKYMYITMIICN